MRRELPRLTHAGRDGPLNLADGATPAFWIASAVTVQTGLAAVALVWFGAGPRGTAIALQLTARAAFMLFLPAYAGGAVTRLLGLRLDVVARHGRALGLAFAAALLVHLGLVGWLCAIGQTPSRGVFLLFGSAAACVYLLALFSIAPLQRLLGSTLWRSMRWVGMNWVAFAFAVDFLSAGFAATPRYLAGYMPFVLLSLGAPACRLAAAMLPARCAPGKAGLRT